MYIFNRSSDTSPDELNFTLRVYFVKRVFVFLYECFIYTVGFFSCWSCTLPLGSLPRHFCGIMGDFYTVLLADVSAIKINLTHSSGFVCFYHPGVEDSPHRGERLSRSGCELARILFKNIFTSQTEITTTTISLNYINPYEVLRFSL